SFVPFFQSALLRFIQLCYKSIFTAHAANVAIIYLFLSRYLLLLNNLDAELSPKQKESINAAKNNAAELLNLLYEQLNNELINIPALPSQHAKINLLIWKKRMGKLLEGKAWHTKAVPVLNGNSQLPRYVIADEHLLSLLVLNLLQNASHLNQENEALQLNLTFEDNVEASTYLYLTLPAPEHPQALTHRKECLSLLNTHLRVGEPSHQALIPPKIRILAKVISGLNAVLLVSKKYDLKIRVPVQIPSEISTSKNQPLKILIVEHQTIVQIALKRILQGEFSQVSLDFADDLAKGIAYLTENEYDLALVDLQLPGDDPFTIVSDLKSTKKFTLIALSAELSNPDEKKLRQLGVNAFLSKPPQREALLQSLQSLQHNWMHKEQP
ncbi:MAG: response regulator, partial [Saprospiraceae bacterium]